MNREPEEKNPNLSGFKAKTNFSRNSGDKVSEGANRGSSRGRWKTLASNLKWIALPKSRMYKENGRTGWCKKSIFDVAIHKKGQCNCVCWLVKVLRTWCGSAGEFSLTNFGCFGGWKEPARHKGTQLHHPVSYFFFSIFAPASARSEEKEKFSVLSGWQWGSAKRRPVPWKGSMSKYCC